jgi:hypothetical protein
VVRVAFTVALLVAVAGVVVPATEYAGVQRSDTAVRDAMERLVAESRALADGNDALPRDAAPARRAVTLELPADGFASAGLRNLSVGPPSTKQSGFDGGPERRGSVVGPDATQFRWRVAGGTEHTEVVDGIRVRPRVGWTLSLSGGRTRLVLRLVAIDGTAVVRTEREG